MSKFNFCLRKFKVAFLLSNIRITRPTNSHAFYVILTHSVVITYSHHIFGRAIWDKLCEYVFENFEDFKIFKNREDDLF